MLKQTLLAASLAALLTGPALAGDPGKRDQDGVTGMVNRVTSKNSPAKKPAKEQEKHEGRAPVQNLERMPMPIRDKRDNSPREVELRRDVANRVWRAADHRDNDWRDDHAGRDRDHDWRDRDHDGDHDRDHDWRDRDHDGDHDWRDRDHDGDHDRDHDWRDRDHDWRRSDWRDHDWRRDDDWRRRGWVYNGWRNDGWRYYRFNDNRHWRYCPPYRYSLDYGYRSGYELAWRDWLNYGRHDHYWRRSAFFGYGTGSLYRSGYEAGWRDAAYYYDRGYRPDYWGYDSQGGWYFSFRIDG